MGYLAKAAVVGAATLVFGELLSFATFLVGQTVLSDRNLDVGLGDAGVLRAVSSAGLYLFVVHGRVRPRSYLPARLLLSNAGHVVAQVHAVAARPRLPSLTLAYLDLAAYPTVALILGGWRVNRDA